MAVMWSGRKLRRVLSALVGKYCHHAHSCNTEKDVETEHNKLQVSRLVSLDAKQCGPLFIAADNKTLFVHGLKAAVPSARLFKLGLTLEHFHILILNFSFFLAMLAAP